ncbi:MAG: lasso peptide biosynthesis B2 protein [Pseudonocardiaceae bacterium]
MSQPQAVERGGKLRLRQRPGVWPTWCTGVHTAPFAAHAWVEADGQPVGEPHGPGYYRPLIVITPEPNAR